MLKKKTLVHHTRRVSHGTVSGRRPNFKCLFILSHGLVTPRDLIGPSPAREGHVCAEPRPRSWRPCRPPQAGLLAPPAAAPLLVLARRLQGHKPHRLPEAPEIPGVAVRVQHWFQRARRTGSRAAARYRRADGRNRGTAHRRLRGDDVCAALGLVPAPVTRETPAGRGADREEAAPPEPRARRGPDPRPDAGPTRADAEARRPSPRRPGPQHPRPGPLPKSRAANRPEGASEPVSRLRPDGGCGCRSRGGAQGAATPATPARFLGHDTAQLASAGTRGREGLTSYRVEKAPTDRVPGRPAAGGTGAHSSRRRGSAGGREGARREQPRGLLRPLRAGSAGAGLGAGSALRAGPSHPSSGCASGTIPRPRPCGVGTTGTARPSYSQCAALLGTDRRPAEDKAKR